MKGLILLFIVITFGIIGWGYMDNASKRNFKSVVSGNIGAIIFASIVVVIAIVVSIQKWDGKLPTTTGGVVPFINVK